MNLVNKIIDYSIDFINNTGLFFGFFMVFIESFIPALPLSVFVALNVNAFGLIVGCLISWCGTCLGSFICYSFFLFLESKFTERFLNKKLVKKIINATERFKNIKFSELVLIITLPFTPSFLVNILSGITKMNKRRYLAAISIGKFFSISFWGVVGRTLIESITDIKSIIYIVLMLIVSYIVSKIVSHKMNIE